MADAGGTPFNVNIGVLGHVDSGKTSLVAALSTVLSTAALDKHPQSKLRGITLDLGFSALTVPCPDHLREAVGGRSEIQFTLVDCPGHASLVRHVIGGANIMDAALLVIDITKGIQTQTAECLVIAEITCAKLLVVLNKIDLVPAAKRARMVAKATAMVNATLALTRFAGCTVVAVSAKPSATPTNGEEGRDAGVQGADSAGPQGVEQLTQQLLNLVPSQPRQIDGDFLFAADHCFAVRGQGTVLTGTVLRGAAAVNDTIELPDTKTVKKIKSMQMFRRPVQRVEAGDRAGICVAQLPPEGIERALVCAPGSLPCFDAAVAAVEKIRFYSGQVKSKSKFHVTVGHATVTAELLCFGLPDGASTCSAQHALMASIHRMVNLSQGTTNDFDIANEYQYQEELYGLEGRPWKSNQDVSQEGDSMHHGPQWVVLKMASPVTAPADALIIGSRLDADLHTSSCRLAFAGRIVHLLRPADAAAFARLKIFKPKLRIGSIERLEKDGCTAICKNLVKKETNPTPFIGMTVTTQRGARGRIESPFGKAGKFKVVFDDAAAAGDMCAGSQVQLHFKRFVYDPDKRRMAQ